MLGNAIFWLGYKLKRPGVLSYYEIFKKSQWLPFEVLQEKQVKQLRRLITYAYHNVPYYIRLFDDIELKPDDITSIRDLDKLPILTKQIIRSNWQEFIPPNITQMKYVNSSTGGSTGEPLKYRMSIEDYERGVALLYRGWSYGGYKLGDKIAVIAGTSLIPKAGSAIRKKMQDYMLNRRSYSSFGMNDVALINYVENMNKFKPRFIRGYASSLYILAEFVKTKGIELKFQPQAIFSTAEKLLDNQRKVIEEVFKTSVFDNYGLNDGGVSAYECEYHNGMHIDMERSVLEVVDEDGKQIVGKPGRILATSLYNYALPFIRYDTGDIGIMVYDKCHCKRELPLLKELVGRTTDVLVLNGKVIGSPVLTVLFGKVDIKQYQIIQKTNRSIICRIVRGPTYREKDEEFIRESFFRHVGNIEITFDYVPSILADKGEKHRFIINRQYEANDE